MANVERNRISGGIGKYFKWLYRNSEGARSALCWNILLGVVSVGLNLFFIYLCKRLVDIATGDSSGNIYFFSGLILGLVVIRLVVRALNTRLENVTYARMNFKIRSRLYSDLMQSQWKGKESHHTGDTLNRLMTDVDKVTTSICSDFPSLITTLIQFAAAFIFFCKLEWKLALMIVLLMPLFVVFSKIFYKRMRELTRNIRNSESKVQSHIQETLQHRVVIQSMENGPLAQDKLTDLQNIEYDQIMDRTRFSIFARTMVGAAFNFGYIIAFLWGVFGIWKGTVTYGIMTAFLQLVGQVQNPSLRLTRQIPAFVRATTSIDRLMELEDSPKEESGDPIIVPGVAGIKAENLTFRYPDGERDIFKDFSFDFAPGSKTAIVGETGVGKSTLIRLMLALLRPVSGKILLYGDGMEVEASALTRRNIVYVPQGNSLFSGTIRDNLLIGNPEATEDQMNKVLKIAAADFVFNLPDGLDTVCGEQGSGLSEGQAQRIAIARALLRPGSILLLDEFSSSLDPDTEEKLMKNLTSADKENTMIFITHREKIALFCDNTLNIER